MLPEHSTGMANASVNKEADTPRGPGVPAHGGGPWLSGHVLHAGAAESGRV